MSLVLTLEWLQNPRFDSYDYLDIAHRGFGDAGPDAQSSLPSAPPSYLDLLSGPSGSGFSLDCELVEKMGTDEMGE